MNEKHSKRVPLEKADEDLAKDIVDAAFNVHAALGPGLLEGAYEHCLSFELVERGHKVQRQVVLPVVYRGRKLDAGYRLDLLVSNRLAIEIKATSELLPIHQAQLLTYLRLSGCRIGFLMNFNSILFRNGIKRLVVGPSGSGLSLGQSTLSALRFTPGCAQVWENAHVRLTPVPRVAASHP